MIGVGRCDEGIRVRVVRGASGGLVKPGGLGGGGEDGSLGSV